MMESTAKLTDTNAVLAYLYETFPLCFFAEGETKPLKIGLFQDLAERLADDSKVSKTQLRVALRRYTSSWRYLKGITVGAQRIDLDGKPCGELSQEHIDHAQLTLKESRERASAKRAEQAKKNAAEKRALINKAKAKQAQFKRHQKSREDDKKAQAKKVAEIENLKPVELSNLKPNQRVNVKLGMTPVKGVVVDINKEDVHVQLDTGLTVKVRSEHILV